MKNVALNVAAAIVGADTLTLITVNATDVQQNLLLPDCLIWTCIVHWNVLLLLGHGESKQAEIRFTRLLVSDDMAGVLWMDDVPIREVVFPVRADRAHLATTRS